MQATVKYPRLAAAIAAIEKTGRTKAQIGRLAGRDGSAATRWAKGTHLPGWSAARSLADSIRGDSPDAADELLAAWHYYSDPVERGPGSAVPDRVAAVVRRFYPDPEQQAEAIKRLEELGEPLSPSGWPGGAGQSAPAEQAEPARRRGRAS